jgi:release factor glutamine methyltransferase
MDIRLQFQQKLGLVMDEREARSVTLLLFEKLCGLSTADLLSGKADVLSTELMHRMEEAVRRVADGEPVQYVVGRADFMDMELEVNPSVLIPRPETEDLVRMVVKENHQLINGRILDIGTGSGCIALALKRELPENEVTGWDVSAGALDVARRNAIHTGLDVVFQERDILDAPCHHIFFDLIVSNPPYICRHEAKEMEGHVLEHEPHTALFVPDNRPLLFYDAIVKFSNTSLNDGGGLYFEVNREYATDVAQLLEFFGYTNVAVFDDQFGNPRIVRGNRSRN